jgi:AraC-like DNA-binding protein
MTANAFPIRIDSLFYREANLAYHTGAHEHRVHQWFFCLHGGMTIAVNGTFFELHPEESLIIPPKASRETWCRQKAPGYLVCIFDAQRLEVDAMCGQVLKMPSELREDVHALVGELRHPQGAESPFLTSSLVVRLLIGHQRAVAAGSAQPASSLSALNAIRHHEVVEQAEVFMQKNLHRQLLRNEIATAVSVSEPHLARLFRAATGKTVLQRLTDMRIVQAKALLLESTLSVTQIAGEVGLSSFSHFTRIFKRAVGVAPSDYRRSGGKSWA